MKLQYGTTPYQWPGGVGVLVLGPRGEHILHPDNCKLSLVAHSHTRELEFVEWSTMKVYPSEPIPEPTK